MGGKKWGKTRLLLSMLALGGLHCYGQPVVSVHAGLILFTEGAVLVDGQPYVPKCNRWSEIPENGQLQTQEGKADVLLSPGIFLRLDAHSGVRLLSNKLFDVQVELLAGSAIIDATRIHPDNSIRLFFRGEQIRIAGTGRYRIDSQPAQVATQSGQLEILRKETVLAVAANHFFSFESADVQETPAPQSDPFDRWAQERQNVDSPTPAPPKAVEGWKKWRARLLAVVVPRG